MAASANGVGAIRPGSVVTYKGETWVVWSAAPHNQWWLTREGRLPVSAKKSEMTTTGMGAQPK